MAGHAGLLIIIALSIIPGSARPHTGAGGGFEHLIAYLLTGACYGLSQVKRNPAIATGLMLAAAAAVLETLQVFIPGRNAEFAGFFSSAAGGGLGLAAGYWIMRIMGRARRQTGAPFDG